MKNENEAKKKGALKSALRSNKFKRGGMATLMSVVFVAIVVVLNIVVSALSERFPSMNMDLTVEKLNTLSEQAVEIARDVKQETNIYLIGSEEAYRKDQLYSNYGLKYSQVANLAERLQEANQNIKVEFIDPDANPKFMGDHAEENLQSGKVLVQTEKRSRVLTLNDMFSQNQQTYEYYSKVDSALAGAIEAVNLDRVPIVAVVTGHDEIFSTDVRSALDSLLTEENFDVQEINLMTEDIPESAQVLLLPAPATDYTDDEIQKMRDFLSEEGPLTDRTVMATCFYSQGKLPKLAGFLEEWGVKVEEGIVAETDSSKVLTDVAYLFAQSAGEVLEENSYSLLISPVTSPLTVLFDANDDIGVEKLWVSSDSAYVLTEDSKEGEEPVTGEQTLATLSSRLVQDGNDVYTKNVMVFGSSQMFAGTFLSGTFSNRQYVADLLHYVTGTDDSAITVSTEEVTTRTMDITASAGVLNVLGLGVFTVGIPVALLIAGIVVFLKRRHL